jgi:hypothetical protein
MNLFKDKRITVIGYIENDLCLNIIENVYSFDQVKCFDYDMIIIGYGNQEYDEMCLQKADKVRLKDYFYIQEVYKLMGKKKLCLMVGTCILLGIERYLLKSKKFSKNYEIIYSDIDLVEEYDLNFVYPDMLLENVDLFLYTRDSSAYRMSNEAIINKLNEACLKLSVSGCIFSGYFPQSFLGKDKINPYGFEDYVNKIFICEIMDKNINERIEKGYSLKTIVSELCNDNYYSHEYISNWIEKSFHFLRISEILTDINIYHFLKENYLNEKLYKSSEHPGNKIIKNLCLQILEKIDCVDIFFLNCDVAEKNTGLPLYPAVRNYLKLEKSCENIILYDRSTNEYINRNFEEYIREYYKLYIEKRDKK